MRTEQIKSQGLEMQGLWSRGYFQKILRTSLTDQDRIFSTRFHYQIKMKESKFDKCKVRLVVQGQHIKRKGADGVGDYDDAFSPVPAASGFHTIFSLATQFEMFTDHIDISPVFVQSELLPGDIHNGNVYFHLHRVTKRILDTFIASSSHCMACRQPPVRGIRQ